jgi:hypothetical protein
VRAPRRAGTLAGLALVLLAGAAGAQDSNYWSIQYGPVAHLLGGQVIAGSRDLSATFYNPGALALAEGGTFLLSAESVQREWLSATPVGGAGLFDISTSRFGAAPSLVAGNLPRWLGKRSRLAWSLLTRQKLDLRLGQRLVDPLGPPVARSTAEMLFDQRVYESWGGLTCSRALTDSMGLGFTWYVAYRGQRTRSELSVQALGSDTSALSALGVDDIDYGHIRTLAKLGWEWSGRDLELGLTVTTPGLGVLTTHAKAGHTRSVSGVDADGDGRPEPPILQAQAAYDLTADYRTSWAIGGGLAWSHGPTRIYVSSEWFAPVAPFAVLEIPARDELPALSVDQELRGVLNAGVGAEHRFGSGVAVYGAFHTDFSAAPHDLSRSVALSDWDLYHLSAGAAFGIGSNRFTLGTSWAFGRRERPVDSPLPPEDAPGVGLDTTLDIRYTKVVFLLGFLFGR